MVAGLFIDRLKDATEAVNLKDNLNWDDLRIFLSLCRAGSVRATGEALGISHSTVARRIDGFERDLDVRLFDRLSTGFSLTQAGEDLLQASTQIEEELFAATRRITGQDARMVGEVRVTLPDLLATDLLMPDLAQFSEDYPDINLEIIASYEVLNISQREADIALRFISAGRQPPEHLVGRKLVSACRCAYATPEYLDAHDLSETKNPSARWIGWDDQVRFPDWVRASAYPHIPVHGRLNNALMQVRAARVGMGLAMLPCFMGDTQPDLVRVPGETPLNNFDLWILTHQDLRDTARMREFRQYITRVIEGYHDLLTGTLTGT